MTLQVCLQLVKAVIEMMPLPVVHVAILANQGHVVPLGIQSPSQVADAVELMEDDQSDHVFVLVLSRGKVYRGVVKVSGFLFGDADVGSG